MKIAISGKGGAGKTTLAASFCLRLAAAGRDVIAVDADSNPNLAYALGFPNPEAIVPLADMDALIREKTSADKGRYGTYFRLNPDVSDIPQRFRHVLGKITLLVMGAVRRGGGGCACPEYVLIRSLISHLLLNTTQDMVIDLEAGLEHLGRGVVENVDALLVVVQPDRVSALTARRIERLARDMGLDRIFGIGNMTRNADDQRYIERQVPDIPFFGFCPFVPDFVAKDDAEQGPRSLILAFGSVLDQILEKLREGVHHGERTGVCGSGIA